MRNMGYSSLGRSPSSPCQFLSFHVCLRPLHVCLPPPCAGPPPHHVNPPPPRTSLLVKLFWNKHYLQSSRRAGQGHFKGRAQHIAGKSVMRELRVNVIAASGIILGPKGKEKFGGCSIQQPSKFQGGDCRTMNYILVSAVTGSGTPAAISESGFPRKQWSGERPGPHTP